MVVERLGGTGDIALEAPGSLTAMVVTRGLVELVTPDGERTRFAMGESALLPAALPPVRALLADDSEAILTRIV